MIVFFKSAALVLFLGLVAAVFLVPDLRMSSFMTAGGFELRLPFLVMILLFLVVLGILGAKTGFYIKKGQVLFLSRPQNNADVSNKNT